MVKTEMWLQERDTVDTLCRGEVAEWLNAAVSKTVTSAIPASGVRIPPSPPGFAGQLVSTLRLTPPLSAVSHQLRGDRFVAPRRKPKFHWHVFSPGVPWQRPSGRMPKADR